MDSRRPEGCPVLGRPVFLEQSWMKPCLRNLLSPECTSGRAAAAWGRRGTVAGAPSSGVEGQTARTASTTPCAAAQTRIIWGALSFSTRNSKALRSPSSLQSNRFTHLLSSEDLLRPWGSCCAEPAAARSFSRPAMLRWVLALPLLLVSSVHTDFPVLPEHHLHGTLPCHLSA